MPGWRPCPLAHTGLGLNLPPIQLSQTAWALTRRPWTLPGSGGFSLGLQNPVSRPLWLVGERLGSEALFFCASWAGTRHHGNPDPLMTQQPCTHQGSRCAPCRSPQGRGYASTRAKGQGGRYGPSVRSGYRPGNRGHVADTSKMVRRATLAGAGEVTLR